MNLKYDAGIGKSSLALYGIGFRLILVESDIDLVVAVVAACT